MQEVIKGFHLSPQQEHLWLQRDKDVYRAYCSIVLEGSLDIYALQASIQAVIDQNEIYRTYLRRVPGMRVPLQIVAEKGLFSWQHIDLGRCHTQEQALKVQEISEQEKQRPIDCEHGPLLHISLITLSNNKHMLLVHTLALHADWNTLHIFTRKVALSYCQGSVDDVVQYTQFSEWQNSMLEEEIGRKGREQWRKKNLSDLFTCSLPGERKSDKPLLFLPDVVTFPLEPSLQKKLSSIVERYRTPVDRFLFVCWKILLWKLMGRKEPWVGLGVDERVYEELAETSGPLTKYVPLFCHLDENQRFVDVLKHSGHVIEEAVEWQQSFIWEDVVHRGTIAEAESAFFPISFDFNKLNALYISNNVSFELQTIYICQEPFRVKLMVVQKEHALSMEFHYDTNVFWADDIQRLAEQFQALVENAIERPETAIYALDILNRHARNQLLIEFNNTQVDIPQNMYMHLLFEKQVARTPNNIAVLDEEQQYSYVELDQRANQLAHYLQELGVGPDVLVGVNMERSTDVLVAILGILKAGGAYVPLDQLYPQERLSFIMAETHMPVLLTQQHLVKDFSSAAQVVSIDSDWSVIAQRDGEKAPTSCVAADNIAYVIYTSGSTGTPKGVMISHGGLVNYLTWCTGYYRVAEGSGSIVHSSIAFDLTITSLFSPLLVGKSVVLVREGQGVEALARALQEGHRFSMVKITPAHLGVLNTCLSANSFADNVRTMVIGGEALLAGNLTPWQTYAPDTRLINEYGPTETVVGCCIYEVPVDQKISGSVPIGRPIANTQLYILDDYLQPLPIGVPGELYIGGRGLARGYCHRPDLTAEQFIPNAFSIQPGTRLYKTGDVACYLPDGTIEYLGRLDQQVKIRGYRIELEEIEAVLLLHPDVHECVVLAREDVLGDKQLVAYVGTDRSVKSFQKELRDYLQEKLPRYMLPSLFVVLDVLPLTPNGKVDRQALPAPELIEDRSNEGVLAPRTPVEDMVKTIWEKVLRLEQVGIHENFFEIGGHSLLATQIASRLRSAFHIDIEVSSIFDAPTIAELASKVEEALRRGSGIHMPPLVPVSREQDLPVSFAQQRLWFFDQLVPHSSFYNIANAGRLSGTLNVKALEQSLKEIVQRHEVLRTTFQTKEGRLVQVIQAASCKMSFIDLSQLSSEWHERETHRLIEKEAALPFDLTYGPLLRSTLLRICPQEHVLLLTMHHIVSDGWSSGIFFRELATLYNAYAAGMPSPLPPLSIHYADFATWQRQWLDGSVLEGHVAYWREHLQDAPPLLELPTDRTRASIYNGQAASQEISLPASLVTSLKSLSHQQDATLFMTLLTVLNIVLFHWTRQADIIVGTVIANRTQAETEQLIGCFMNFLALRSQLVGEQRASELLSQIRAIVLEAHTHQDCPFDKLAEVLRPDRTRYHNPFYNVAFLLQNLPVEDQIHEELLVSSLSPVIQSALLDLRFVASETSNGLLLSCEYDRALFDSETIEELLLSYLQVVDTLVQEPDKEIAAFVLSDELMKRAMTAFRRDQTEMIAITASFTAEPVEESLAYWLREFDLSAHIRFAPYHQVFQQLLDPTSMFASNQAGVNVILFRFEDWQHAGQSELDQEQIERQLDDFVHVLLAAVQRACVPYVVCVCPASPVEEGSNEAQRAAFLAHMEDRLEAAVAEVSGCFLIKSTETQAMYPVTNFYDPYGEKEGHLPFTSSFFVALGTMLARKIIALRRSAYKVIVVDCDQTLWSGVVGEDGASGVGITPSNIALQEFLVSQQAQGMLLCVCSKNQEQDVLEVFVQHPEMPLQQEHIVAWRVNWLPKSENLRSLAEELDLSLESFILLDDNPLECAEVQANCPEVLTLLLPQDTDHISHILQHLWVFDHVQVTAEDKQRTALYVQQQQRQAWQKEAPTLEKFLAELKLQVEITPLKETQLDRVSQLTQRTNQFNCTNRRRTAGELRQFCQQGGTCLVVEVRDRFGEYGVVGVLLFQNEPTGFLNVDTFLLSCRAMGRGVEHQMLARLGTIALEYGLSSVHVPFIASEKNIPAIDFLEAVGKPFKQIRGEILLFDFPPKIIAPLTYKPLARFADAGEANLSRTPLAGSKVTIRIRSAGSSQLLHIATKVSTVEQILQELSSQRSRSPEHHRAVVAPRTEIEEQLVEIWQSLLGLRQVSIHDNFFEIGGHSLLATQLLSRVVEVLHVEVPLRSLFEAPTIARLAQELEHAPQSKLERQIPALCRADRDQPLPLSFAQQRLWFLDQLEPGLPTYNMPLAVRFSGSLHLAALLKSLHEIVQRHESLRTAFRLQDDQPVQLILPASIFQARTVLLDSVSESGQEAQVQMLIQQEAQHPFDLACGPLLRATLLCLKKQEYVLLLTLHHIASDGWSEGILTRELFTLYRAFTAGELSPLPTLPIQYADFAVWQRQWLQGEVLQRQLDYWCSHLAQVSPLELPIDHPRPAVQTFAGASQSLMLPLALHQELQVLSQREGVTLFMLLLSTFQILLARYSGQRNFTIGTPVANRTCNGIEGLIGFFVNTLVICSDLSGDLTFPELLQRVREACLGAFAHQDVPFEKLVEVLQPQRDLSRSPLFQVMFILQHAPTVAQALPELQISDLRVEHRTTKFDLTLEIKPNTEGLYCEVEYNYTLFKPETIERLLIHWQVLLQGIVADPQQRVNTLPLLSEKERQQLLFQWDATRQIAPTGQSLHALCRQQAERTPDRVALVFELAQLSYGFLDAQASILARRLQALGCQPDQLVGICMERSLELVIGLLAILKAGGAYVPLDPAYPPERIRYMLQDSQVSIVLIQEALRELLAEVEATVVYVDEQIAQPGRKGDQETACEQELITAGQLAYMIYTSGSTGRPKGVQISHRAVVNFLQSMRQAPGLRAEDVLVALTTISFDIAALELFLPLSVGARIQLGSREVATDSELLMTLLREAGATVMQATPATWHLLLATGWRGDHALKILCGGEALPLALAQALLERSGEVWNMYGPTETTIWSTCLQLGLKQEQISIGTAIANTQVYVLDPCMQAVPTGGRGEIYIGGMGVARGYAGRGDLTAERFVPDPFGKEPGARLYRTGDRGRYRADGHLECLGRLDQQVKLRGYRIELGEVEAILCKQEQVKEAIVVIRTRGDADSTLVAYVVPREDKIVKREKLQEQLRKQLPDYMVPTLFVQLETLPRTPNGKVDREALPFPENQGAGRSKSQERSRTPIEELLATIWCELLDLPDIRIQENFFELGGHSLLATQLVSRMRELLQIEVSLRSVFELPTIAQLAQQVEQALIDTPALPVPPPIAASRQQPLPLSFAQQRLWFLDQLEPENAAYILYGGVSLQGQIAVEALQRSLQEIVRRHESLRTTFEEHQGEVVQIIHEPQELCVPLCDLSGLGQIEQKREGQWLGRQLASVPFDLRRGPLLRGLLARVSLREHSLLVSMHHIISDAWSVGVLVQELTTLYRAFIAGKPSPLAPLPLQYADFALWQRNRLKGEVLDMHINYWRKQLRGVTPLELSTDRPKQALTSSQGATHSFVLSTQLTEDLRNLSREEGVTLFMTLLAAFQILLYRYANQRDIVVGTDIANRTHMELEGIIGFFVNLLVLRTSLTSLDTFRKVLKQVRGMLLNAYAHQDLPFEKLVEALQLDRMGQQTPLVNTLFVMQNTPPSTLEFEGTTISPLNIENHTAKFDLAMFIAESEQGLIGSVDYRTDLFDSNSIERLCDHFAVLLQSIVTSPVVPIKSLEIRTEEEKAQQASEKALSQEAGFRKLKASKRSPIKHANSNPSEANLNTDDLSEEANSNSLL